MSIILNPVRDESYITWLGSQEVFARTSIPVTLTSMAPAGTFPFSNVAHTAPSSLWTNPVGLSSWANDVSDTNPLSPFRGSDDGSGFTIPSCKVHGFGFGDEGLALTNRWDHTSPIVVGVACGYTAFNQLAYAAERPQGHLPFISATGAISPESIFSSPGSKFVLNSAAIAEFVRMPDNGLTTESRFGGLTFESARVTARERLKWIIQAAKSCPKVSEHLKRFSLLIAKSISRKRFFERHLVDFQELCEIIEFPESDLPWLIAEMSRALKELGTWVWLKFLRLRRNKSRPQESPVVEFSLRERDKQKLWPLLMSFHNA